MYALYRTSILTNTAACAFIVVDSSKVVYYLDRALGTNLLALAAGDTAVYTSLTNLSALVMAGAFNYSLNGIGNERNDVVGAGTGAESAADALSGIDSGNSAIGNVDSISGANGNTVTVTKTSECTMSVTCKSHISGNTGLKANVLVLFILGMASAVTSNVSNHLNNVLGFSTHNSGKALCNTVATCGTKVGL
jgi:hypothetical protein